MTTNQKCLVAISVILLLFAAYLTITFVPHVGLPESLPVILPIAVIGTLPALWIWWGNRARKKQRSPNPIVLTHSAPPKNFDQIEIGEFDSLPPICTTCGSATKRTSLVRFQSHETQYNKYDWSRVNPALALFLLIKMTGVLIWAALIQLIEHMLGKARAARGDLRFRIPHCAECATRYPLLQRHLDFHGRTMIIYARREFVLAMKKIVG